jgi:hypothetical protein
MEEGNYLGRGIHNSKIITSLKSGNLRQMLEIIIKDEDLDVQIRENYLNVYYRGGNIAKVNSENSVEFDMFYFYLNMKQVPKKIAKKDKTIVSDLETKRNYLIKEFKEVRYQEYFKRAKTIMDEWLLINPKPERMEQHKLSLENRYNQSDYTIIDLEYEVSTRSDFSCMYIPSGKTKAKQPKFDIISVNKQGRLCLIELKKGKNALDGTSGLQEHWDCFQQSVGLNPKPFVREMQALLKQKQEFNLIDKRLTLRDTIPKFMFAYCYDDKDTIEAQNDALRSSYNKIGEEIPLIILKPGTFKLLNT